MKLLRSACNRRLGPLFVCVLAISALLAPATASAAAKPLTPEAVHTRILKRGLGNWVGVQLLNGVAFTGRIVTVDQESFTLQLQHDPAVTPVYYSDVAYLSTGISRGGMWAILGAGIGGLVAMAVVAHHEMAEMPKAPTQPVLP